MIKRLLRIKTFYFVLIVLLSSINVYAIDPMADRALLEAASRGDSRGIREALSRGAYIDARDILGNTPLIVASDNGYQEIVRYLIEHKASINALNKYGYSALLSAMVNSYRGIVSLLLVAGADPALENIYGTSAEILLATAGYQDFIEYIDDTATEIGNRELISPFPKRGSTGAIHNSRWREHFNALLTEGKPEEASEYLIAIASNSNFEAQYLLGFLLLERGSYETGTRWLLRSTESDDPEILYNVGKIFLTGNYEVLSSTGIELLNRARIMGSLPAEVEIAKAQLFGLGTKKDYTSAFRVFKKAVESGNVEAEYYLGYCYFTGRGIEKDEVVGLDYIGSAGLRGLDEANEFIARLQSEEIMKLIAVSGVEDRAILNSALLSFNATMLQESDNTCDIYDISQLISNEYGLQRLELCYVDDNRVVVKYFTTIVDDDDLLLYLQNIAKDASFERMSPYND